MFQIYIPILRFTYLIFLAKKEMFYGMLITILTRIYLINEQGGINEYGGQN